MSAPRPAGAGARRLAGPGQALPADPEVYLIAAQVAELLQVSPKTVFRWAASGKLPSVQIAGTVRFMPRERLLAWLQDRERRAGRQFPKPLQSAGVAATSAAHAPISAPRRVG
jgi:excisionase family DNA binding protein